MLPHTEVTTTIKEKLGQLPRPLAGLPVVLCACVLPFGGAKFDILLGVSSQAEKASSAPKETLPAAAGEMEGFGPMAVFACLLSQKRGRHPQNSASSAAHSCPHSLSQGTADQHCPCQRHNPGKCCRAKLIPKISEIHICSKR